MPFVEFSHSKVGTIQGIHGLATPSGTIPSRTEGEHGRSSTQGDAGAKRGLEDCTEVIWPPWLRISICFCFIPVPPYSPTQQPCTTPVLDRFHYCCDKNTNQTQLGQERVCLAYAPHIIKGSQDRNSDRAGTGDSSWCKGHRGMLLTDLFFMAYSACFLIEPRATSPETAPLTTGWALPHPSLI